MSESSTSLARPHFAIARRRCNVRLKKHEDELEFFAREMQSRCVYLGPWRGLPIALYGLLSNYGRSYGRPLVALFIVFVIGAGAFWCCDARTFGEALGLSAANTLNVFGILKVFNLVIDTPLAWLNVFAAVQTIFGLGADLDAALEVLAQGNSAIATTRLARLDERLASLPDGGSEASFALQARGSILAISEALIEHASYFDAGAPG
jgi:hypothetical protein